MITVTAAEARRRFGLYRAAAQREPVTITGHGRESVVLLSVSEYKRLKWQDHAAYHAWELVDGDLEAIAATEAVEEAASADHEDAP